jgi:hypothetical protein
MREGASHHLHADIFTPRIDCNVSAIYPTWEVNRRVARPAFFAVDQFWPL